MKQLLIALMPALVIATTPVLAADKPAAAPTATATKTPVPPRAPVANGKARVAQGTTVPLYTSAWQKAELAALRPNYADLKPRARTNRE
ncbi:MAG: hypothetical protein JNM50_08305 [Chromatiales bacterium]|nr:hypothetical protein [Chromatiales bacterium]